MKGRNKVLFKRNSADTYEAVLDAAAIDECSDRVRSFFREKKAEARDTLRYALSTEEILLKYLDENDGEELHVRLVTGVRFFRPFVSISVDGKAKNVFLEKNQGVLQESLLKNIGISPDYVYSGEQNTYTFQMPGKKFGSFAQLGIAVLCAAFVGIAGLSVPDSIRGTLSLLLSMLHDTFLNLLGAVAGPMIFLSVAWGIYGIGDAATLKQIGRRMITGYFGTVFLAVCVCGLLALPFFHINLAGQAGNSGELFDVFSMLLGIIPGNILSPFMEGNTLQIIFLAVLFGVALLFLEKKTTAVAKATEQLSLIVQFLIEIISRLVPFFVFIVITDMIWSNKTEIFLTVGKLVIAVAIAILLTSAVVILNTSRVNRIRPVRLIRKGLPTLIVGLTTASSAAAFGSNIIESRDELGIPENVYSFGLPLGIVTFKASSGLLYTMLALFFAEKYGSTESLTWVFVVFVVAAMIALATPPIPGGSVIAYTMLISILGLPEEALVICIAVDTILDFLVTGFDQFMIPFVLLNLSTRLGLTDREILMREKNRSGKK